MQAMLAAARATLFVCLPIHPSLSLVSTPFIKTFLRYFGHHTTWYLQEKTILLLDLNLTYSEPGYTALSHIMVAKATIDLSP